MVLDCQADKVCSSDLTAFSGDNLDIVVYENSFVYRNEISAMTTTQTKFGISGKDVIGMFLSCCSNSSTETSSQWRQMTTKSGLSLADY